MIDEKLYHFLKEEESWNRPTSERVERLKKLKQEEPEKAEEMISEGLKSDNYNVKEICATVEAQDGNERGIEALKELIDQEYPPYTYEYDGREYSSKDPTHRRNIVRQLKRHGEDITEEMKKVLRDDLDSYTANRALSYLYSNGEIEDEEELRNFMEERDCSEKQIEQAVQKLEGLVEKNDRGGIFSWIKSLISR